MAPRALLLPVTGHHADDAALETAFTVANAFEAHLAAVCIRPDPVDIVRYVADWTSPVLSGDAVAAVEAEAQAAAHSAGGAFEQWRQSRKLPLWSERGTEGCVSVSWQERVGAPAVILRDMARFADLVVMRGLGPEGPVDGDAMLEVVLFDAGRPILLAPPKPAENLFDTALVAWAGGREEVRAVSAALPFLTRMKRIEIRTVGDREDAEIAQLVTYLGRHGVTVKAEVMSGGHSVGDALLAEEKRVGASLLVMGAYHHSRAREAVFGGTTRQIITHVEIPVLLAH